MHSMSVGDYTIHYNSDFSGYLSVVHGLSVSTIPFEVFEEVVAARMRMDIFSRLEQMNGNQFLKHVVESYNG